MHVVHVVGARPNFMKAAPVFRALGERRGFRQTIVHTGQHYDFSMSRIFLRQLGIPEPEVNLEVGSGSHGQQTGDVMIRLEDWISVNPADLLLVYGDVNSTLAAALVGSKLRIKVGHVEAGLRSRDRSMPEEINRLVTDQLADFLFTPSADGDENLIAEGVAMERIHRVGNVMIDTLFTLLDEARLDKIRLPFEVPPAYALVTVHRPSNVDAMQQFRALFEALHDLSRKVPIIFPVHPRTRAKVDELSANWDTDGDMMLVEPLGYIEFLALQRGATVVITDSGGIQEETTYLGVPCLTLRDNTERPITVTMGTNTLIGSDTQRLRAEVNAILAGTSKSGSRPPLWDGHAAQRIADILEQP